jgi:hypothetical protein
VVKTKASVFALALAACGGQTAERATTGKGSGGGGGASGFAASGGSGARAGGSGGVLGRGGSDGSAGAIGGFAGSAGSAGSVSACPAVEIVPSPALDIVLAVDTSSTMQPEVDELLSGFNAFVDRLQAGGIDARLILLASHPQASTLGLCVPAPLGSGSCAAQGADSNLPRFFHHPTATVRDNDSLNVIYATFMDYRVHLRKGTAKTVFVVSDGNATAPPYDSADAFITGFSALDPELLAGWKFAALYAFDACPSAREVGTVYNAISIVRPLFEGNLCALPANEHLDTLAAELINVTPTMCSWEVPKVRPDGREVDLQKVNLELHLGLETPRLLYHTLDATECSPMRGEWYYDTASTPVRIVLCPATCQQIQKQRARLSLLFGCYTSEF